MPSRLRSWLRPCSSLGLCGLVAAGLPSAASAATPIAGAGAWTGGRGQGPEGPHPSWHEAGSHGGPGPGRRGRGQDAPSHGGEVPATTANPNAEVDIVGLNPARSRPAADSLVVEKALRRLTVYTGGFPVRTYNIALGTNPTGAKVQEGDARTPEGLYHIDLRNPNSLYHRGLHVSYPNDADRARSAALGVDPGGDIMIHGLPQGQGRVGRQHRAHDWTNGCMAMTDQEVEDLWTLVPVGTPIHILP